MKRIFYTILTVLLFILIDKGFSQTIKGKIVDAANSEPLSGAVVKILNTKLGAVSDIDGSYTIEHITPGSCDIKVSYIGYTDKTIKNISVNSNSVTKLDIALDVDGLTTDVIVVESNSTLANEQALLVEQKNSNKVQDGISEQQIKRAPDAAASDVLKRVTGVSVVSGKYVFVRGTSERYNNTMLNGVTLPSTDPDKKSFSFDLFPSNLLENVIISKTFTPDQPANFSGGLVQITTKEFPDALTMSINMSSAYNDNTSSKTFYEYKANDKKLLFMNLGIDDSRLLPSNFPTIQLKNTNFSRDQIKDFGRSLPNNWMQSGTKAPLNSGFQISIGNSLNLAKIPIGFLAAYSYKSGFSNNNIARTDFNSDNTKLSSFNGRNSEFSVLWGGLINLNAKLGKNNKISFKSSFTHSSEDETQYYEGFVNGTSGSDAFDRKLYITKFTQRSLASYQLFGEHLISNFLKTDWMFSYSQTEKKEPDMKTMTYQRSLNSEDAYYAAINPNYGNTYAGGRFFSNLNDINRSFSVNFELPVNWKVPFISGSGSHTRIKIGTLANGISRDFGVRNFGVGYYIGMPFNILYQPIESIFTPDNFDVNKLFYDELTTETDKYKATENNYAGYLMADIPIKKLRIIAGVRYESNEQKVNTLGIIGNPVTNFLKNNDVLPSINTIFKLSDNSNIRAAYSQTISRPELREIAPFSYVDFVSGILVLGNSIDLRRTLVRNYDLRYEIFPEAGEIVSVSLFYKSIDAPIEEVFIPTSTNRIKTFNNAPSGATNYGLELEFRKNLGFIYKHLTNFSVYGNLSLIESNIDITGLGSVATSQKRRMQGQSPYMINLGLYYDNFIAGTSVNLSYNRFGDRISEVGLNGFNDIRELGRDLLDISASKSLFGKFEVKLAIKDILNQDQKFVQNIEGKDETVRKYNSGTNYSLTLSYKY
ncbi:MAG: outer membrane beta-barrel protein [Ignavibacteria bacterium]|nr:outer membrane beta-barrel protein [Ignavibacteria bacterium]